MQHLQGSEVAQVRAKGKALQLILAVESLRNDLKRQKTAAEESKLVGGESTCVWDKNQYRFLALFPGSTAQRFFALWKTWVFPKCKNPGQWSLGMRL